MKVLNGVAVSKQIQKFKQRKARQFPDLGIKVCKDYYLSLEPKNYSQNKKLISRY